MTIGLSAAVAIAACAAQVEMIDADAPDGGKLLVYGGTRPDDPDTAAGDDPLIEFDLPNPAFGTPVDGPAGATATASAIDPVPALEDGTVTWFRVTDNTGNPVFDGNATATGGGGDLIISAVNVTAGLEISVTSFTYTQPKNNRF